MHERTTKGRPGVAPSAAAAHVRPANAATIDHPPPAPRYAVRDLAFDRPPGQGAVGGGRLIEPAATGPLQARWVTGPDGQPMWVPDGPEDEQAAGEASGSNSTSSSSNPQRAPRRPARGRGSGPRAPIASAAAAASSSSTALPAPSPGGSSSAGRGGWARGRAQGRPTPAIQGAGDDRRRRYDRGSEPRAPIASASAASSSSSSTAPPAPSEGGSSSAGGGGRAGGRAPGAPDPAIQGPIDAWRRGEGVGPGYRTVAGRRPRIGVIDRGPPGHGYDRALVARGTGARVVSLGPGADDPNVDGLFVPGGRFNLPGTLGDADLKHEPKSDADAAAWNARIAFQNERIGRARDACVPTLGVCGGSRSMAQNALDPGRNEGQGETYLLDHASQARHNRAMARPWDVAHNIVVDPHSQMGRIMRGEHWRDEGQPLLTRPQSGGVPAGADPRLYAPPEAAGEPLSVRVNSMHWAAVRFQPPGGGNNNNAPAPAAQVHVAAHEGAQEAGGRVVEGWERRGGGLFMGVQSHPEFAQIPAGDFHPDDSLRHARIMAALGQAATEHLAIQTLRENPLFMGGLRRRLERIRTRRRGASASSAARQVSPQDEEPK